MANSRPILFSGPMVRALLENTKTQTRRMVKPTLVIDKRFSGGAYIPTKDHADLAVECPYVDIACPYGQTGDRLWVRETHAPQSDCWGAWERSKLHGCLQDNPIIHYAADEGCRPFIEKWRPSIFMPRWASRITLEITGVRVERLQDISEVDAQAEGIERIGGETSCTPWRNYGLKPGSPNVMNCSSPITSYATLWASINGPGSWDANPWVWVLEFTRHNAALTGSQEAQP